MSIAENKFPAVKTPVTTRSLVAALRQAWPSGSQQAVELLAAHSALETGWWAQCWNYGAWNAKATVLQDHCYRACGEELQPTYAAELLQAAPSLVTIVGPSKTAGLVSVNFKPEHFMTRFRAFTSLDASVNDHVDMMRADFPAAWAALVTANPVLYVDALKSEGYFTADKAPYATGVAGCLERVRHDLAPSADPLAYLVALFTPRPFESPGAYVARCVRGLNGAHPAKDGVLFHLAAKVERNPAAEMYRTTNCATTMRWILAWLGCPHPWCYLPDEVIRKLDPGGPVSWIRRIMIELGALVDLHGKDIALILAEGWGIRYWSGGNNDHVEWCLDDDLADPEPEEHGGGGRAGNYITVASGDLHWSAGRPAVEGFNPNRMKLAEWVAPPYDGADLALQSALDAGRAASGAIWSAAASERPTLPDLEE